VINERVVRAVVTAVPDELLTDPMVAPEFATPEAARDRYAAYLTSRLSSPRRFAQEAEQARNRVAHRVPQRLAARR